MQPTAAAVKRGPLGVYYGWWMVVVGTLITTIGSIQGSLTSVFFLPLAQELNVSRATLSLVFSVERAEGGIEGPIVGWMIDKFGPKVPIMLGAILGGVGLLLLGTVVDSYLAFFIVHAGIVTLGFGMGFLQCMHAVANLWFVKYRTRVMSVFSSSVRLGPAIFTPLLALIVLSYGWRNGAILAGVLVVATTLPLSYFIRRSPESMGLQPDGASPDQIREAGHGTGAKASSKVTEIPVDFAFKEALRTPAFWIIAMSTTVRLATQSAVHVHFIPIFVWKGLDEKAAAYMVGLVALTATPLILATGWIGDMWSKKAILLAGQVCVAMSFVVLALLDSTWSLFLFVVLFAFGANVSPVNYSILGEYFGRKVFARLRGALNSIGMVGMVTPVFAGWVFDTTQSYAVAALTFGGMAVVAAVALIFLRRPVKHLPS